jgi:hypothetical protein
MALMQEVIDEILAESRARVEERAARAPPAAAAVSAPNAITREQLGAYFRAQVKTIVDLAVPRFEAIERRLDALQERVNELERKGYVGIWREGREYSPQSECTHDGARWFCHKRTSDKPGSSADWVLMEKSAPLSTPAPRSDETTSRPRQNGHYANPRPRAP